MRGEIFAALTDKTTAREGRRQALMLLASGGLSLLVALGVPIHPAGAKKKHKHKKKKKKPKKLTGQQRVDDCLTVTLPYCCYTLKGCPDRGTLTPAGVACEENCWIPVTACCSQAAISYDASCACLDALSWFICPV